MRQRRARQRRRARPPTGPAGRRLRSRLGGLAWGLLALGVLPARVAQAHVPFEITSTARTASALQFLRLGVEHILTGYDHLLFLLGLLIVCTRFRGVLTIVSCFTLAHSVTLALAGTGVLMLPSRVVEPLIAASIVFVGVENVVRARQGTAPRGRWALTFAFGLIHGFGFAGALRDLGLGAAGVPIAVPLLSFNLGVELGQVAVASVLLPLVWRLRAIPAFARHGVTVVSAAISAAGLYWLIARVL